MAAVPSPRPVMNAIKKIPTALADVFVLEPRVFGDDRGFFFESYNERAMAQVGVIEPKHQRGNSLREAETFE